MSIIDRWAVLDHCVDCGLPCVRTLCPYYSSGATVECDVCGYEWDVPLDSPEMTDDNGDVHLCERCAAKCDGKAAQASSKVGACRCNVPTIEQVAWVFERLREHLELGGTFRKLIYDRMGFGPEAYLRLYYAGGMIISNKLNETDEPEDVEEETK